MRTTITLEDHAFAAAQTYAQANAMRLGQAVSELVLRALRSSPQDTAGLVQEGDFWVIAPPVDTPVLTAEQVKNLLDAD